jgi:imidazole glycerol-phosphate synthase subunit HisF
MVLKRIIPCVLYSDEGLVKTKKFRSPNYIGDPINSIRLFNDKEVDELLFIDIDASKNKSEPNFTLVQEIASECFMPLSYGGGIKDVHTVEKLLKMGVEKVSINSALLSNLDLCKKISTEFGSSTLIGSIDVKKNLIGRYRVYNHIQKKTLSLDPIDYVKQLEANGVGEIFINNVDLDGTFSGYDISLLQEIENKLSVPIIPCGGAGSLTDLAEVFNKTKIKAVAAGSIFVYTGKFNAVLINFPTEDQKEQIMNSYEV